MKFIKYFFLACVVTVLFTNCSKSGYSPAPVPTTAPVVAPAPTICFLSGISQHNSGTKTEFALTAVYDNNYNVKAISVYDSTVNKTTFDADFNYVTSDSIGIGQYQYIRLDESKHVVLFSTKSDLSNPSNADDYKFKYSYDSEGYLLRKELYINSSALPNFSTLYTYTGTLLTSCVMTAASASNLKVLEADLSYDNTFTIKNWIYTFPDATIENKYNAVLNFGKRSVNPIKRVSTKIYNPVSGVLLDTWNTTYGGYKLNSSGNIIYGEATGDLQQGIAVFYGKTNFYYSCH
jgi:hypothetical protein